MLKSDLYDTWCCKCVNEFGLDTQAPCRQCLAKTDYVSSCNRPLNFEPTSSFGIWCNKCMNKSVRESSDECTQCYAASSESSSTAPTRFNQAMIFDRCCPRCVSYGLDIEAYPCSECSDEFCGDFPTEFREGWE